MLFVFIVSSGRLENFNMSLAVKKVLELKTEIAKTLLIPVEDQVLLCSGGEELKLDNIVGNYFGAGTDTNPIFLFSKNFEAEIPCNAPVKASIDLSIADDVDNCANMAPSSNTLAVRASLAQRLADAAVSGLHDCDELVNGQHLQQQGWAAVIANLEDAKDALLKRKHRFEELYEKYMANRSCYQETIKRFPSDIELLSRIPLLPKLMLGSECIEEDLTTEHTLLSWFCSEPLAVLQSLTEKYQRSLDELNETTLLVLEEDVSTVVKKIDDPDIREVPGIEERLSSLNRQKEDVIRIEKDQRKLAAWFPQTQKNLNRENLVAPELCVTFQKHLEIMLGNHLALGGILERCTNAKNELSHSINRRIKRIISVEDEMYKLHVRLMFLEKHVQYVMQQYESFHQVHLAPTRYFKLLAEVCRRRLFSSAFIRWATELSAQAFALHSKEASIRKSFMSKDAKNMVDNLFPGMEDMPPPFAIECPQPFDQSLPNILREDLNILKVHFPELAHLCEVPLPDPMPCVAQAAETDSALSSTGPSSSKNIGDSEGKKGSTSSHALTAPSADYSSLPSEYASMPNGMFSLTSSPFEDPLLPSNNLELTPKRTKIHTLEESDGEEFETVDRFGPTIEIGHPVTERKRSSSAPRPNSTPEAINVCEANGERCPKLSKACSDGDTVSPIQERLKHSDSLMVSTDFQSTEYYIDDSMPSSYTESNATSPLLRGNKTFKSHHMVVAELQKQVEEKNCAFKGVVRFIRDLQSNLQNDLASLRSHISQELGEKSEDVARLTESINQTLSHLQERMLAEKEGEVSRLKNESVLLETKFLKQLEVECQKLNDAETQITNYEEHLQYLSANLEETKQENEQIGYELGKKQELIRSMMLEHELELDSIRQELQVREEEVASLKQVLSEKQSVIEKGIERHMEDVSLLEQRNSDRMQLQKEIKRLHEGKVAVADIRSDEELLRVRDELEKTQQELLKLKSQSEEHLAQEISSLEERLSAQHRDEMESLRSRYKMAVSTTTIDATEGVIRADDLQKILEEHRQRWVAEKEECIQRVLKEQEKRLEEESNRHHEATAALVQEHEENIEKMKSRQLAEVQVSFNEAINSVTKEKDSVIESLRSKVSTLEGNLHAIKLYLEELSGTSAEVTTVLLSQSDSGASSSLRGMEALEKFRSDIQPFLLVAEDLTSSQDDTKRDEQFKKMKLSCRSKLSPCLECSFKISILSCNEGDLILLCYEEKHESFVVFHFGQFVHFLHTDSLQPLGLKIPADLSERWALGVVTSKEFCVTKKPSNRYKIHMGAKFYRVKVKPWEREKAVRCHQLHRSGNQKGQTSPSEGESPKGMSASSI